jgi:hypothetical protein
LWILGSWFWEVKWKEVWAIYIYIYIYMYWTNKSLSVSTSSCSSGFCCSWGFLICGSRHLSLPKIGIRINVSCHRGSRNFSEIKHMKVAHVFNPSKNLALLRGWNQEDHSSRPEQASSLPYPISKITRAKWVGVVAQMIEHLLCKCEGLRSNLNPTKKMLLIILLRCFF